MLYFCATALRSQTSQQGRIAVAKLGMMQHVLRARKQPGIKKYYYHDQYTETRVPR